MRISFEPAFRIWVTQKCTTLLRPPGGGGERPATHLRPPPPYNCLCNMNLGRRTNDDVPYPPYELDAVHEDAGVQGHGSSSHKEPEHAV